MPSAQCQTCRHYRGAVDDPNAAPELAAAVHACAAFPSGIPDAITFNRHDHRTPLPGDAGIQWAPRAGAPWPGLQPRADGDE